MSSAIRTLDGVELPAPGTWQIDPGHAEVAFVGRHFGLTRVRGRFPGVHGTVVITDELVDSTVEVGIDMASVESGSVDRDDHLRSVDLFDVEAHPAATFRSTRLAVDGTSAVLVGDLTIKSITRPVTLDVEYLGSARDPWDNDRAVFTARGSINRHDWGITWNMVLEAGGLLVSKEIDILIDVELIRQ